MRRPLGNAPTKLLIAGLGASVAFLLATSPVVAQAAAYITSADIVDDTVQSQDVKDDGLTGQDIREATLSTVPRSANAGKLAGRPATAYLDQATVYSIDKPDPSVNTKILIPLAAGGNYDVSYSAYLDDAPAGNSGCHLDRLVDNTLLQYYAEESGDADQPGYAGSAVISPAAGERVELFCYAAGPWKTYPVEPIQIVVRSLDTVTNRTLTPAAVP